jgi:hypothetical protein
VLAAISRAKTKARVSSKSLCLAVRAALCLSTLDSCVARPAGSRSSLRSSRASRSYSYCSSSSTACSHSSMALTRTTSSSACLMVSLAQASAEVYNSLASASIHGESRWQVLMAVCSLFSSSSLTSRCCCLAFALALFTVVRYLIMEAYNGRRRRSSTMPPLSRWSRFWAWVSAQRAVPIASSRETSPGALSVGYPRMTSGSTAPSSSTASMEKHAPPDGPAELAGSSAATSSVVTLAALAATAAPVTGTPPPPTAPSLG